MPTFSLLVIIYSLFVSFVSKVPASSVKNPLMSYFNIQSQFVLNHRFVFFLCFVVLTLLFLLFNNNRKGKLLKSYPRFLQRFLSVLVLGWATSFLILFVIALIEVNVLSAFTYINPNVLGVVSNPQLIIEKMKKSNIPPRVIVGEEEDLLIPAIARAQSGKDSFYGSRIIPHVSSYVLIPMKKTNSGVLMVGNTLIVAKVDSPEFQTISPVISYLYINSYFRNRNIRHYPQIELLDKQRYQKYRKEDFTKKLQLYEELIQKIKDESTTVAEGIAQQQQEVLLNEENLTKLKAQREKDYIKCVNTGYYESGVFHKIYSKEDCLEQLIEQDDLIAQTQKKSEVLASSLKVDEKKLDNYQTYLKFYTNQKALTQEESGYISYEFATFNPPDEIKVALTLQDSPLALADYLELMIHEYLHYATFDESGKTLTSNFFMEGLTEYFARNIVKENLGVETNIGYPANIRIIGQMTKRIAERDIADVYFANDQAGLEELLDRVYQDGFYKDNIITLETLQYSSDKDQIIKLANEVLENIGGAPLTQDDIKTTYSTFE